jgi:two-component system NtrC family sensor kinase
MLQAKEPVHIADLIADPAYSEREPRRVAIVELAGARILLTVPMLKENKVVGAICIYLGISQHARGAS